MTPRSLIAPARLARAPVLATQSDERLVDLVRAGHDSAFETIVARYRGALLRYAEGFLGGDRAEDAVQQAFVRAYEAMRRDDAELNLRPWLYRIVHNTALNSLRDRALQHGELPEDLDGVERPDQVLERTQSLREVLGAVATLPPRQRDAIVLRELEGRSYDEIAHELGVSGGAVRQLLNRARNTVRSAATAVVPIGLVSRLPWTASSEPLAARVAEWSAAAGAGAVATKVCATALVTGAVVGGVAVAPEDRDQRAAAPDRAVTAPQRPEAERPGSSAPAPAAAAGGQAAERRDGDRSGPGDGERRESERDDRSGEGAGDGDRSSRSGSGDGERDEPERDDSSGPGSGDEDRPAGGAEDLPDASSAGAGSSGSGSSGPSSSGPDSSGPDSSGPDSSGPGPSGSEQDEPEDSG